MTTPRNLKKLDGGHPSIPHPKQADKSHPLSKAMTKKPKPVNQVSESWADEQVESWSQRNRNINKTEHQRRRDDIEKDLKKAEIQLGTMADLLKKREDFLKEKEEEEHKIDDTGVLTENRIDPVTGQPIPQNEEDDKKKEVTKKFTKKRVQALRDKLHAMDMKTESCLADIENTMQFLDSIDSAIDRAGPYSAETLKLFGAEGNEEEVVAKIYKENEAVFIKSKNSKKEISDDSEDDDLDDDEVDADKKNKDHFFLTEQEQDGVTPNSHSTKTNSGTESDDREKSTNSSTEQG